MLLKFNYIQKLKVKKYTLFFLSETNKDAAIIFFFLQNEMYHEIIHLFIRFRALMKNQLPLILRKARQLVYYRLKTLIDFEILTFIEGPNKELELNPEKKTLIHKVFRHSMRS